MHDQNTAHILSVQFIVIHPALSILNKYTMLQQINLNQLMYWLDIQTIWAISRDWISNFHLIETTNVQMYSIDEKSRLFKL